MNKLKIVFNFLKIKLKNIGSVLLKGSTAYMIGAFGLIQVASIVADNINIAESLGVTKEIFMQYLFLGVIFLFPVFLIVTFIIKNNSINGWQGRLCWNIPFICSYNISNGVLRKI